MTVHQGNAASDRLHATPTTTDTDGPTAVQPVVHRYGSINNRSVIDKSVINRRPTPTYSRSNTDVFAVLAPTRGTVLRLFCCWWTCSLPMVYRQFSSIRVVPRVVHGPWRPDWSTLFGLTLAVTTHDGQQSVVYLVSGQWSVVGPSLVGRSLVGPWSVTPSKPGSNGH